MLHKYISERLAPRDSAYLDLYKSGCNSGSNSNCSNSTGGGENEHDAGLPSGKQGQDFNSDIAELTQSLAKKYTTLSILENAFTPNQLIENVALSSSKFYLGLAMQLLTYLSRI